MELPEGVPAWLQLNTGIDFKGDHRDDAPPRTCSNELSPLTIATMAEELGIIEDDNEFSLPPAANDQSLCVQLQPVVNRGFVEATVHKQHRAWQHAMAASLYNADGTTRDLLSRVVNDRNDPRHTMHIVAGLHSTQVMALHPPARALIEGLRLATRRRLKKIHAAAHLRITKRRCQRA